MTAIIKIVGVAFLIAANAFFVASEFALVSVRRTRLETRANNGSRGARAALRLLEEPTTFISAVQLGVTLASLALGWIGEPTIATFLEPVALAIAPAGRAHYVAHALALVVAFSTISFLQILIALPFIPKLSCDSWLI